MTAPLPFTQTYSAVSVPSDWETIAYAVNDPAGEGGGSEVQVGIAASATPGSEVEVKVVTTSAESAIETITDQSAFTSFEAVAAPAGRVEIQARRKEGDGGLAIAKIGGLSGEFEEPSTPPVPLETEISIQPAAAGSSDGGRAVFAVQAVGISLSYDWEVSTDDGVSFTSLGAPDSNELVLEPVTTAMDDNQYRVVVTGSNGVATSSAATLTVGALTAPIVTDDIDGVVTVIGGGRAVWTAEAEGEVLSWELLLNGAPVAGEGTSGTGRVAEWAIETVSPSADGFTVQFRFYNNAGEAFTSVSTLTVTGEAEDGLLVTDVELGFLGRGSVPAGDNATVTAQPIKFSKNETITLPTGGHDGTVLAVFSHRGPSQDTADIDTLPGGWVTIENATPGSEHWPGIKAFAIWTDGTESDMSWRAPDTGSVTVFKDPRLLDLANIKMTTGRPPYGTVSAELNVGADYDLGIVVVATNGLTDPVDPPSSQGWSTSVTENWYSGHQPFWRVGSGGPATVGTPPNELWTWATIGAKAYTPAVIAADLGPWSIVSGTLSGSGVGDAVASDDTDGVSVDYDGGNGGVLEIKSEGSIDLDGGQLTLIDLNVRAVLGSAVPAGKGYQIDAQLEELDGTPISALTKLGTFNPAETVLFKQGSLSIPVDTASSVFDSPVRIRITGTIVTIDTDPDPDPDPPPVPGGRLQRPRMVELWRSQGSGNIRTLSVADRYVNPTSGSDGANGLTRQTAWRTMQHAADQVGNQGLAIGYMSGNIARADFRQRHSGTNWHNRVNTHYVLEGERCTISGDYSSRPAVWVQPSDGGHCAYLQFSGFEIGNTNFSPGNIDWTSGIHLDAVNHPGRVHHIIVADIDSQFFDGNAVGGYCTYIRHLNCRFKYSGWYHTGGGSNSSFLRVQIRPTNGDNTPVGVIDGQGMQMWFENCFSAESRQSVASSLIGYPNTLTDGNSYIVDQMGGGGSANVAYVNCIAIGSGGRGFNMFEGATEAWYINCLSASNGKHSYLVNDPSDPVFGKWGYGRDQAEFKTASYTSNANSPNIRVHWWNCVAEVPPWHDNAFKIEGGKVTSVDAKNNKRVGGNDGYSQPIGTLGIVDNTSTADKFDARLKQGSPLATGGDLALLNRAGVTQDFAGNPLPPAGNGHVGPYSYFVETTPDPPDPDPDPEPDPDPDPEPLSDIDRWNFYGAFEAPAVEGINPVKANRHLSHRFVSPVSGQMDGWLNFFGSNRGPGPKTGYSAGDGGTYRVRLVRSTGGSNGGVPDMSKELAAMTWDPTLVDGVVGGLANKENYASMWPVWHTKKYWELPVDLVAGETYHVVYENIHPNAASNFMALADNLAYSPARNEIGPGKTEWGLCISYSADVNTGWSESTNREVHNSQGARYAPCALALMHDPAKNFGNSYTAEVLWQPVAGSNMARQRFTPTAPKIVDAVSVAVKGSGTLTGRLKRGSTVLKVWSWNVANPNADFVYSYFSAITLQASAEHYLEFSGTGSLEMSTNRDATIGLAGGTHPAGGSMNEGWAEASSNTGSTWTAIGGTDKRHDLGGVGLRLLTTPPPPTPLATDHRMGVVGMTSLANSVVSGSRKMSYRIQAEHTSDIQTLRLYFIDNATGSGYANGTGGKIRVQIAPDNGSGFPDESRIFPGKIDATFGLTNGRYEGADRADFVDNKLLGVWTFDQPIPVVAGGTYHIMFRNVDPNPSTNSISIDLVIDLSQRPITGICIIDPARPPNLGFIRDLGGGWSDITCDSDGDTWTPIYELRYANGGIQGQGIMQWDVVDSFQLAGSSAVRTTINLPDDQIVSRLAARVERSTTGSVALQIETLAGTVLRSVNAATNGVHNYRNAVWAQGTVEPFTLKANTDYAFVVRTVGGYSGDVVPLQAGLNYGFDASSIMPYGVAQTSTDGSNWTTWLSGRRYFSFSLK